MKLRITARMQNAHLGEYVDAHGGLIPAGKELDISSATLSAWLNFRSHPVRRRPDGSLYMRPKSAEAVHKICEFLGKAIDDVFTRDYALPVLRGHDH